MGKGKRVRAQRREEAGAFATLDAVTRLGEALSGMLERSRDTSVTAGSVLADPRGAVPDAVARQVQKLSGLLEARGWAFDRLSEPGFLMWTWPPSGRSGDETDILITTGEDEPGGFGVRVTLAGDVDESGIRLDPDELIEQLDVIEANRWGDSDPFSQLRNRLCDGH